jgi:hypothetical protein
MGEFVIRRGSRSGEVITYGARKTADGSFEPLVNTAPQKGKGSKWRSTAYRRAKAIALAIWKAATYKIEPLTETARLSLWLDLARYSGVEIFETEKATES